MKKFLPGPTIDQIFSAIGITILIFPAITIVYTLVSGIEVPNLETAISLRIILCVILILRHRYHVAAILTACSMIAHRVNNPTPPGTGVTLHSGVTL